MSMTCAVIMTREPITAAEDDTVALAAARLVEHRAINLPVVNDAGVFIGMFGIFDIVRLVIPTVALAGGLLPNVRFMADSADELRARFRDVRHRKLHEVVDRDVRVVHPDTPEIEALRLFCQQHTTLAVVERDTRKLIGIVSYWDAVSALTGMKKGRLDLSSPPEGEREKS
jgi:CBS-domain-containing membrane protein